VRYRNILTYLLTYLKFVVKLRAWMTKSGNKICDVKMNINIKQENVLDCDQSNYSSRIILSYTFTLETNTNWIG